MSDLTTPELLFLEEYLSSLTNTRKFVQYCSQEAEDPAIRSLCTLIAATDQRSENDFAGFIKKGTLQ